MDVYKIPIMDTIDENSEYGFFCILENDVLLEKEDDWSYKKKRNNDLQHSTVEPEFDDVNLKWRHKVYFVISVYFGLIVILGIEAYLSLK